MPKVPEEATLNINAPESMGLSPGALAKRNLVKKLWCPKYNIEFDKNCDEDNPKTITYKQVLKAACVIKNVLPKSLLIKSRCMPKLPMELFFKIEVFHPTGSFFDRGAVNALYNLKTEDKSHGVITASLGNWAMALAYYCRKLHVSVTVVFPEGINHYAVEKCTDLKANVVFHGKCLADAKRHAFEIIAQAEKPGPTYINGYDYPHVISANGTIAVEIFEDLPDADVIIVPVGGGGLIAGIAAAAKVIHPDVKIYGVELAHSCSFFKALDNQRPFKTAVEYGISPSLAVATAGFNSFHTAKSLVDKMVLVESDWVARAILHLLEDERIVAEGAGATSLAALLAVPDILPELKEKKVVCVVSGGNVDTVVLPRCIELGKAADGRLIRLVVTISSQNQMAEQLHVLSMISNVGGNVVYYDTEEHWIEESDTCTTRLTLIIETRDLEHACSIKRVMEKLFPNQCEFLEDPFSPIPICVCFPKKRIFE